MTQALLNNLNITQDNSYSTNDNVAKTDTIDFAKIFNKKTADNSSNNQQQTQTNDNTATVFSDTNITTDRTNTVQDNVIHSIGDLKIDLNSDETLIKEFENAVQDCIANTIVDLAIIDEDAAIVEEEDTVAVEEAIAEDVEEIIDNELNQITDEIIETIITDEDPTMYKELNTLENPTVALMLHSQIQTTVKNVVSEKNTETTNEDSVSLLKTNDKDLNNTNLFKQFDNTSSKDITQTLTKESPEIKTELPKSNKVLDEKFVKELNVQVVEAENENGASSNNLMQQQTPQEQVTKIMIQGDVKFDKLQFEALKTMEVKPTEITANKIIEQITKQLDGMYNNSKLNIVLNPGTLGKVNLHIINSKDGLLAQFTVTTQDAKEILMKGLSGLKESLLSQGISVDNVSVRLEESNDSENNSDWTEQEGSRGGNKQQGSRKNQKEQEKPFEQMMFELNNDGKV